MRTHRISMFAVAGAVLLAAGAPVNTVGLGIIVNLGVKPIGPAVHPHSPRPGLGNPAEPDRLGNPVPVARETYFKVGGFLSGHSTIILGFVDLSNRGNKQ